MFKQANIQRSEGQRDVIPLFAGEERCKPSHAFGPYIREHYLLHFCLSGTGVFYNKDGAHPVHAGEFFIIRTGEVTRYEADAKDPWHYIWIAFRGTVSSRFDALGAVCQTPCGCTKKLKELIDAGEEGSDLYCAFLYELSHALSLEGTSQDALTGVHRYIRYHYMEELSVELLSRSFGFERSYLFRSFKRRYGVSVKEYITEVRMHHAKDFLAQGMRVSETARIVGYKDEFNFSRAYKKYYNKSPKADKCK